MSDNSSVDTREASIGPEKQAPARTKAENIVGHAFGLPERPTNGADDSRTSAAGEILRTAATVAPEDTTGLAAKVLEKATE